MMGFLCRAVRQTVRQTLRLSVLTGIGVGVWKMLKSGAGAPWKSDVGDRLADQGNGAAGGPPPVVITPPTSPATLRTPAAEGAPNGKAAEEAGPTRPATARPPKAPARTGPARKAPTGRAEDPPGERVWVTANDGVCPPTHPVKAKLASKIFHVPGARNYSRVRADRCYPDAAAAEADGMRAPMR